MSKELGAVVVMGAAIAASTAILAIALWLIGRAEDRWEHRERDRLAARHYGRDERP